MIPLEQVIHTRNKELCITEIEIPSKKKRMSKSTVKVIDCSTYEALVQSIGYLKFISDGPVYYRGQNQIYSSSFPLASIFRTGRQSVTDSLESLLSTLACTPDSEEDSRCKVAKKTIFHDIPAYALEGVMQHYGINTRWLDITDSLPHALFFSIAKYRKVKLTDYPNSAYERKSGGSCCSRYMRNELVYIDSAIPPKEHCYLIAFTPGQQRELTSLKGLTKYSKGEVLDARMAIPSYYLRPHSQHGLMFKKSVQEDEIESWIYRLKIEDVKKWLGNAAAFSPSVMYPPIRKVVNLLSNPLVTSTIDKGLSDIETSLTRLYKVTNDCVEVPSPKYNPLKQLRNYVTLESLTEDMIYSGFSKAPSKRIDWVLK